MQVLILYLYINIKNRILTAFLPQHIITVRIARCVIEQNIGERMSECVGDPGELRK